MAGIFRMTQQYNAGFGPSSPDGAQNIDPGSGINGINPGNDRARRGLKYHVIRQFHPYRETAVAFLVFRAAQSQAFYERLNTYVEIDDPEMPLFAVNTNTHLLPGHLCNPASRIDQIGRLPIDLRLQNGETVVGGSQNNPAHIPLEVAAFPGIPDALIVDPYLMPGPEHAPVMGMVVRKILGKHFAMHPIKRMYVIGPRPFSIYRGRGRAVEQYGIRALEQVESLL